MPRQSVSVAVIALRSLLLLLLFTRCACAGRSVAWQWQPAGALRTAAAGADHLISSSDRDFLRMAIGYM
jgi:hypothetical protein